MLKRFVGLAYTRLFCSRGRRLVPGAVLNEDAPSSLIKSDIALPITSRVLSWLIPVWLILSCFKPVVAGADLASADYFYSLVPKAAWNYTANQDGTVYTFQRVIADATRTLQGTATSGIQEFLNSQAYQTWWVDNSNGIRWFRNEFAGAYANTYASLAVNPPLLYLPATITTNATYDYTASFGLIPSAGSEPADYSGTMQGSMQIMGFESVITKAGTFNCLKAQYSEMWAIEDVTYWPSTTWWLAEKVGIVKSIESADGSTTTLELESYAIPGVATAPIITAQPQSQTVKTGESATFSVVAAGTEPLVYQWQFQGTNLTGQNGTSLVLTQVQTNQAGAYRVIISNSAGTNNSAEAILTVTPAEVPALPLRIISYSRSPDHKFIFGFQCDAGKTYQVEISTNLVNWTGLDNVSATATNMTFQDDGSLATPKRFYRIKIAAGGLALPLIVQQPQSQTSTLNATVTFVVEATGEDLHYQWKKDNQILNGENAATLSLTAITTNQAGSYTVEVSNATGKVTSQAAILTISVPVSGDAILPVPGLIYPAATKFGSPLFGVEFTIPAKWKGGMKVQTPFLLFASDTEPGTILAAMGFASTLNDVLNDNALLHGFQMTLLGTPVMFLPTDAANPLKQPSANRVSADYAGQGRDQYGNLVPWTIGLEIVIHPDGGDIVFLGITTQQYWNQHRPSLRAFADSAQTTPRPTNTDYMLQLNGRSFKWGGAGNDWYHGDYVSNASLSSWQDNHVFFCASGYFEVNVNSTGYATSNVSHGFSSEFLSLSYDSSTKEYGQWTIIQSPQYGNLLMMVTLSGYQIVPIRIEPDGSVLVGQAKLVFESSFQCQN